MKIFATKLWRIVRKVVDKLIEMIAWLNSNIWTQINLFTKNNFWNPKSDTGIINWRLGLVPSLDFRGNLEISKMFVSIRPLTWSLWVCKSDSMKQRILAFRDVADFSAEGFATFGDFYFAQPSLADHNAKISSADSYRASKLPFMIKANNF